MVLVPSIEAENDTPAQQEAREARAHDSAPRSRFWQRIRRAQQLRRVQRLRTQRQALRARALARTGSRAAARGAAGRVAARGGARVIANPVGLAITAVVVAAIVSIRLSTGRPLEGLGADINKAILGDLDEQARARMNVRSRFASDPILQRIAAANGGPTAQMVEIFNSLYDRDLAEVLGRTRIEERFPVDNIVDIMILRAAEAFRGGSKEGEAAGSSAAPIGRTSPR